MYKKIEDCCKYQEQIKKLSKTKKRKKKQIVIDDDCEDRGDESVRGAVKKRLTPVKTRYVSEIDRGIERIKPSVSVRDEYSSSRHIRCVKDPQMSDNLEGNSALDNSGKHKKLKKPTNKTKPIRMQDLNSKKIKSVKSSGKGRQQGEVTDEDSSTDSYSSSECDEICSFDSDINLSGVTLTVEDQATVMDNYAKAHTAYNAHMSLTVGSKVNESEVNENKLYRTSMTLPVN